MLHSALEKETKNTQADNMECYTNEKRSWSLKKKKTFFPAFRISLAYPSLMFLHHTHTCKYVPLLYTEFRIHKINKVVMFSSRECVCL